MMHVIFVTTDGTEKNRDEANGPEIKVTVKRGGFKLAREIDAGRSPQWLREFVASKTAARQTRPLRPAVGHGVAVEVEGVGITQIRTDD